MPSMAVALSAAWHAFCAFPSSFSSSPSLLLLLLLECLFIKWQATWCWWLAAILMRIRLGMIEETGNCEVVVVWRNCWHRMGNGKNHCRKCKFCFCCSCCCSSGDDAINPTMHFWQCISNFTVEQWIIFSNTTDQKCEIWRFKKV